LTYFEKKSLVAFLRQKVFRNPSICDKELTELSGLFFEKEFPKKTNLVSAGDKWSKIFFIHRGIIRLYYTDAEGREFNKGFFQEGDLLWPVAPSARNNEILFNIAALEDIKVSVCKFASFYSWLSNHSYWEKFALPYAESFAEEKFLREYEFLMLSAAEKFQNFCIKNPELSKRIPDYHLATYLGITNVSLSRIKNR
jgi:CRP/FNR family transcriptional regulator, anaerobic regulatory protein